MMLVFCLLAIIFPNQIVIPKCNILRGPISDTDDLFFTDSILHCEPLRRSNSSEIVSLYNANVTAIRLANSEIVLSTAPKRLEWLSLTSVFIFSRCRFMINRNFCRLKWNVHTLVFDSCKANFSRLFKCKFERLESLTLIDSNVFTLRTFANLKKLRWLKLIHANLSDLSYDLFGRLNLLDNLEIKHEHWCDSCEQDWIITRAKLSSFGKIRQRLSGTCRNRLTNIITLFDHLRCGFNLEPCGQCWLARTSEGKCILSAYDEKIDRFSCRRLAYKSTFGGSYFTLNQQIVLDTPTALLKLNPYNHSSQSQFQQLCTQSSVSLSQLNHDLFGFTKKLVEIYSVSEKNHEKCLTGQHPIFEMEEDVEVCDSLGDEHKNFCEFLKTKNGNIDLFKHVKIAHFGQCTNDCRSAFCSNWDEICTRSFVDGKPQCLRGKFNEQCNIYDPVCDTDGFTHLNECYLLNSRRNYGQVRKLAYRGPCRANVTCQEARCAKSETCWPSYGAGQQIVCHDSKSILDSPLCKLEQQHALWPLCGADNQTYAGLCDWAQHIIETNTFVDIKSMNPC